MPKLFKPTAGVHSAYSRLRSVAYVSFSGGRTSGYLLKHVLEANRDSGRTIHVTFCNTGKEFEETLEFVDECDKRWKANVVWLEYCQDKKSPPYRMGRGNLPNVGQHSWRIVDYKTASRNGEPFEQLIDSLAAFRKAAKDKPPVLPNPVQRMCSSELKQRTMARFMESLGHAKYSAVVGLRYDEPARVFQLLGCATSRNDIVCPLFEAKVNEGHILDFWGKQPFDLKLRNDPCLGTYQGNCDLCFLKKAIKIKTLVKAEPNRADWWAGMEEKTGQTFRKDRFSYVDLRDGKVPLALVDEGDEQQTCFCHD